MSIISALRRGSANHPLISGRIFDLFLPTTCLVWNIGAFWATDPSSTIPWSGTNVCFVILVPIHRFFFFPPHYDYLVGPAGEHRPGHFKLNRAKTELCSLPFATPIRPITWVSCVTLPSRWTCPCRQLLNLATCVILLSKLWPFLGLHMAKIHPSPPHFTPWLLQPPLPWLWL